MTGETEAFSPASVTCFFSPEIAERKTESISRGCAIDLDHGVSASVRTAVSTSVSFNGSEMRIEPVERLLARLAPEPVALAFRTDLPIGSGFGVSAACCVSAALALAGHFDLDHSRHELGMAAHLSEVESGTGLGDVSSQLCGGVVYRECRTGPLDARQLPIAADTLYYRVYGDLSTSAVLSDPGLVARVKAAGQRAMDWLAENEASAGLDDILRRSWEFTTDAGLDIDAQVNECVRQVYAEGGTASMIMLGRSVLSTMPVGNPDEWTACRLDTDGARSIA